MPMSWLRRLALALRDRARASWRDFVGTDGADGDTLLFAYERRSAPWLLEGTVLVALLALCGWLPPEPAWAHFEWIFVRLRIQELDARGPIIPGSLADIQWRAWHRSIVAVPFLAVALAMVALLRTVRTRWLLGLLLAAWPPALLMALSALTTLPKWAETRAGWALSTIDSPPLPVPMWCGVLPPLALAMAAVVGAIYASRRRLSAMRVVVGAVAACVAMQLALYRDPAFFLTASGAARMALPVLLALAFVALPHNRAAVARFVGCDWPTGGERPAPTFADSLGVHLAALGFAVVAVGAIAVASIHETTFRRLHEPPAPRQRSADLVNAYAILGDAFRQRWPQWDPADLMWWDKDVQVAEYNYWNHDPDVALLRKDLGKFLSPDAVSALAAALPLEREDAAFARMDPHLSQWIEAARSADYYDPFASGESTGSSFGPFRDIARLLAVRATLRAHRGDVDGSLADIDAILRMGGLLAESRTHLVAAAIGRATQGIAGTAVEGCLPLWRDDPAALARLAEVLEREAPRVVPPIDWSNMAYEAGPQGFIYPFELANPGYSMTGRNWNITSDRFRRVQIAVAVLRFHHDRGAWPAAVADLAPEYLPREPRSPFTGWRYVLRPPVGDAPPAIAVVLPGGKVDDLDAYPTVRQPPPPTPAPPRRGIIGR